MKIDVIELIENEDGSADCVLDLDKEAKEFFIEQGFLSVLRKVIDKCKEEVK